MSGKPVPDLETAVRDFNDPRSTDEFRDKLRFKIEVEKLHALRLISNSLVDIARALDGRQGLIHETAEIVEAIRNARRS